MVRELEPSLIERDFVLSAIEKDSRLDGRSCRQLRDVCLSFPGDFGVVDCRLGKTRVLCSVSAEISRPREERPYEGNLVLNAQVSPLASAAHETGRSSEKATLIARLLEKAIRQSGAVDREALCIVAAEKVWSLRVDLHFLNDHGNLVDCACIAAVTALLHFRKPEVTVAGKEVTIHSTEERVPVPLSIHHAPFCLTYAFYESINSMVIDPTHIEEQLSDGAMTLTLNAQSEICVLTKAGGAPMEIETIMNCIHSASQQIKELDVQVKQALAEDSKDRRLQDGEAGLGQIRQP